MDQSVEGGVENAELLRPESGGSLSAAASSENVAKSNAGSPAKSMSSDNVAIEEEDEKPIDDDEFNIPVLDFEPTLESILNDVDDVSWSDDEAQGVMIDAGQPIHNSNNIVPPDGSDTISIISKESSDNRSRSSTRSLRPRSNFGHAAKKPNSILRHVLLKGMTSQVNSASDKINAGTATAIAIGSLVAVGTSHGYVLVFDSMQVMKWCLGESAHREEGGSVSSLAVSPSGTRLLVGYAKGLILMYDLENGKLLRTMHEAHAVGTAVLILRFTDNPVLALCSDSGGSVFELGFKRTMGVRGCDSRCIFSGSRGELCIFEPLMLYSYPDNPLNRCVIVALATLSKIIVVMIRPKLKVLFMYALACDQTTLPLLAWQMVIIQTTRNEKVVDPVLTFARENVIYFYQVTLDTRNVVQFLPLQKISVNYTLLSLHWLNARTLAVVDVREKLHVMDVRSQEELETVDLNQVRLVYASSHFKGLATGGNVSRAFAVAGERACYNSILCFSNQIIVLGTKSVHALTMRSWHERLDYLVKQGHFVDALQLGYDLYLEKAKAVVGLKGNKDSKRLVVREKLLYILDRYVNKIPELSYMDDLSTAKQNYQTAISTCINYYVLLDNTYPIFDNLYEICSPNPISKSAYLESLEPFILNDQLRTMPPTVVKDFISYYEELGSVKPLEACIVHINVESLDIHQTMKLCWTHGLYDAIIYIYNQGMNDYVTPLEELMTELQSAMSSEIQLTDMQIALGNKILVYTSCCLAGRAYPYGDIPSNYVEKAQADIFRLITSLHTRNSLDSEQSYPYLKTLLKFDTREFLNVLSLSFEEPIFQTELGRRQKQRLVDILLQVMVQQGDFTPTEVGILFTFLARQMAKPENSLYVSKLLFEQVLEHLTSAKETARVDERQQALLELLQAGGLQHFEHEKLLEKSLQAKFYRVCEMLYERKQEYDKMIECYLYDESRKGQIFSFLHKIFRLKPNKKDEMYAKFKSSLPEIVEIDNQKTAGVVYSYMSQRVGDLVKSLEPLPEKLYLFLRGIFQWREQNSNINHMDTLTTEKYIELMCRFDPGSVYQFLKTVDTYHSDLVLEMCQKNKLVEAQGYLLERGGKIHEAFELMLREFRVKIEELYSKMEILRNISSPEDLSHFETWKAMHKLLLVMVPFSQRNSPKLSKEERERLWLPLLESLIGTHNQFKGNQLVTSAFTELTKYVLSSMMGHLPLTTIVEIVLNDPSYQKATFSEIRDLVMGMLDTCTYEESMVDLVKSITQSDVHGKLSRKLRYSKLGFAPKNKICPGCHSNFTPEQFSFTSGDQARVIVFLCGHSFHSDCCSGQSIVKCSLCHTQANLVQDGESGDSSDNNVSFSSSSNHGASSLWPGHREEEENEHVISHSEFELKLEVPTKLYDLKGGF